MKTKEFIKRIESLGYEVSYNRGTVYIKRVGFAILALDYLDEWNIDVSYPGFEEMRWNDKKELMHIVSEYMLTDPTEREEGKRYKLAMTAPIVRDSAYKYLNLTYGEFIVNESEDTDEFKTIFTESEVAQMDITGFEKIEVADGE